MELKFYLSTTSGGVHYLTLFIPSMSGHQHPSSGTVTWTQYPRVEKDISGD